MANVKRFNLDPDPTSHYDTEPDPDPKFAKVGSVPPH